MLLKTQIRRRSQTLNNYIAQIDDKINHKKYGEAIKLVQNNKKLIYNSYLAPYDPNIYVLDSLKTKRDKLHSMIDKLKKQIRIKQQHIQSIRMRRGYNQQPKTEAPTLAKLSHNNTANSEHRKTQNNTNNSSNSIKFAIKMMQSIKQQQQQEEQHEFMNKITNKNVGIYVSRFSLSLNDIEKIDYQSVVMSTNYHAIRIEQKQHDYNADIDQEHGLQARNIMDISFDDVITFQECYRHILISWSGHNFIENFMIMNFITDQEKEVWLRVIKLCKIIQQSKYKKSKLFQPIESQNQLQYLNSELPQSDKDSDVIVHKNEESSQRHSEKPHHLPVKSVNLLLGHNKTAAYQRLRRQSEFVPFDLKADRFRKGSEDLTILKSNINSQSNNNSRHLKHFKSQKSFDDNVSQSNSYRTKKQQPPREFFTTPKQHAATLNNNNSSLYPPFTRKVDKIYQQRNNLIQEHQVTPTNNKLQNNSNIFLNSSVINWIEEQDEKSRSSFKSKQQFYFSNDHETSLHDNYQQQQPNQDIQNIHSEHISEDPAEVDDSPTLPHNLRTKTKSNGFKLHPVRTAQQYDEEIQLNDQVDWGKHQDIQDGNSQDKQQSNSNNYNQQNLNQIQSGSSHVQEKKVVHLGDDLPSSPNSPSRHNPISQNQHENGTDLSNNQDQQSSNQSQKTSQRFNFADLEVGVKVWKCSIDGWNPHKKLLKLSKNHKQLHWKDQKNNEVKKVLLHQIQSILYRYSDAGITKHIKKNIQAAKCLTIRCQTENNKTKNLQFYLCEGFDAGVLEIFAQNLNGYIDYRNNKI